MTSDQNHHADDVHTRSERLGALRGLEEWIETPMQVLGFLWRRCRARPDSVA